MSVVVAILAGGAGSRIGGGKPIRLLGGTRLLDHAYAKAGAMGAPVILVVRDPCQADGFAGTVVVDAPAIEGPMAGLASALAWATKARADKVLTLPCDMPFVPADLRSRLELALSGPQGAAVAASGERLHPICALWRTSVLETLVQRAGEGRLSLHGLSEAVGCGVAHWSSADGDPFININTAADLAVAETILQRQAR